MLKDWEKKSNTIWEHKGRQKYLRIGKAMDKTYTRKKPDNYYFVSLCFWMKNWWRTYTKPIPEDREKYLSKKHFKTIGEAKKFAINYMKKHN